MLLLLAFILMAASALAAQTVDIRGSIAWNVHLPNATDLDASTRVSLNRGQYSSLVYSNGDFVIHHVPLGEYVCEVVSPTHAFETVYVQVIEDEQGKAVVNTQPFHPLRLPRPVESNTDAKPNAELENTPVPPLRLTPHLRLIDKIYDAPSSSIFNTLKSPMVLLMIFTGVLAFAAPKLLNSVEKEMPPEDAKRLRDLREKMASGLGGAGSTDWSGQLAGRLAGMQEAKSAAEASTASQTKRRKGRQ